MVRQSHIMNDPQHIRDVSRHGMAPKGTCRSYSLTNTAWLKTLSLLLLLLGESEGFLLARSPGGAAWKDALEEKDPERVIMRPEGHGKISSPWMEKALDALDAATRFFENNYDKIILDGIFGLRVAEGQVLSAISWLSSPYASQEMLQYGPRLARLQQRMHASAKAAIPYLLLNNKKYFEVFSDLVYDPYVVSYNPRMVSPPVDKKASSALPTPFYREKRGDACFADLMGRSMTNDEPAPIRCTISDTCYHMMTDPGKTDYTLTHQLLFFIQAQHGGCGEKVERLFKTKANLEQFEENVCSKIYAEASRLSEGGHVSPHLQDLFLEQGVVCGMIGFESFLRPDWLDMITSWQSKKGCFTDDDDSYKPSNGQPQRKPGGTEVLNGDIASHLSRVVVLAPGAQVEHHILLETMCIEVSDRPKRFMKRHLLYEEELDETGHTGQGCLSHKSGLGISLLGIYVRYLIEHDGQFPKN